MILEKIEKKIRSKYRTSSPKNANDRGFILSDGVIIPVMGNHAAMCKTIGTKLADILDVGVCRYLFTLRIQGMIAAFEYTTLTPEQKNTMRTLLKVDDFYTVITTKTVIDRFHPIRSIQF